MDFDFGMDPGFDGGFDGDFGPEPFFEADFNGDIPFEEPAYFNDIPPLEEIPPAEDIFELPEETYSMEPVSPEMDLYPESSTMPDMNLVVPEALPGSDISPTEMGPLPLEIPPSDYMPIELEPIDTGIETYPSDYSPDAFQPLPDMSLYPSETLPDMSINPETLPDMSINPLDTLPLDDALPLPDYGIYPSEPLPDMSINPENLPDTSINPFEPLPADDGLPLPDMNINPGPLPDTSINPFESLPADNGDAPSYIGPEETEIFHSPETTDEIEPGVGPNPTWQEAPADPESNVDEPDLLPGSIAPQDSVPSDSDLTPPEEPIPGDVIPPTQDQPDATTPTDIPTDLTPEQMDLYDQINKVNDQIQKDFSEFLPESTKPIDFGQVEIRPAEEFRPGVYGTYDPDTGKLMINEDAGGATETIIHEALHMQSDKGETITDNGHTFHIVGIEEVTVDPSSGEKFPGNVLLNEGITEMLTIKTAENMGMTDISPAYQDQVEVAEALADEVGLDTIQHAYLNANPEELRAAVDAKFGEGSYNEINTRLNLGDIDGAIALIRSGTMKE